MASIRRDVVRVVAFRTSEEAEHAACALRVAGTADIRPVSRNEGDVARELGCDVIGIDECVLDETQDGQTVVFRLVSEKTVRRKTDPDDDVFRLERDFELVYDSQDLV